jgi:uncharacterized protein YjiS (DUF1127 family)
MTIYTEKLDSVSISGHTLERLRHQIGAWAARQALKYRLAQERRLLAEMPDAQLRDIGINRADADLEAASSQIPAARLRLEAQKTCR